VNAFFQELFHSGVYKKTQGRITRQVTWAAMAVALFLGLWRLEQTLLAFDVDREWRYGVCTVLLLAGLWIAFRVVNVPVFADFLIAVEAEINKVSWPTRGELIRASLVVLVMIFVLAAVLYVFDLVWFQVFHWIGIL